MSLAAGARGRDGKWLVALAALGFIALLFLTPLAIGFGAIAYLTPIFACGAILLAFAGLSFSFTARRAEPIRPWLIVAVVLLVVGSLLPSLRRSVPLDRVFYLDRLGILFASILSYLGAIAVLRDGRARVLRRVLPRVLLLGCAMHVGYGLYRYFAGDQDRMAGLVLQPNFFASIVAAFALPSILPELARRSQRSRAGLVVASVALLCALLFSGSRAGVLLTVIASFVFALGTRGGRKLGFSIAGAVALVVVVLATVPNPLKARLERKLDQSFPRTFIWGEAGRIALEHPLGIGLGMHQYYFAQRAFIPAEPSLAYRRHEIGIAHDIVLGSAAEAGILGGLGALILVLRFLGLAATRRGRSRFLGNATLRATTCAAGTLVLHSLVDGVAQNVVALGSLVVLAAMAEVGLDPSPRRARRKRSVRSVALASLVTAAIAFAALPTSLAFLTSRALRSGMEAAAARDFGAARDAFLLARRLVPSNAPAALSSAILAQREFERTKTGAAALEVDYWCAELARANPFDTRAYTIAGDTRRALYFSEAKEDRALLRAARDQYDRALTFDPLDLKTRLLRIRLHRLLGDDELAVSDLDEVLRIEPAHPLALESYGDFELSRGNRAAARARYVAAIDAWRAAQAVLSEGRYGKLSYLTEIVLGFTPADCEERIRNIDAGR